MSAVDQILLPFQIQHAATIATLPREESNFLHRSSVLMRIARGERLFQQGSYARGVYQIVSGKIKVFQEKEGGQRRLLHVYSEGELLGYRPLLADGLHVFTAEALEDCTLRFVPKDAFTDLLQGSPSFAQWLLRVLGQEFAAWSNFQSAFDSSPVRARVALVLLILHEKYRLPGNATAVIRFSRTDLAEYAMTTLETAVRTLREFRESGIVHLNGRRMLLSDINALIAMTVPAGIPNRAAA